LTRAKRTFFSLQRFARADKRAKLPRWINQYITETASNVSTDMAITMSKLFMRKISQNPNENQTGISLWTLEDVLKAQEKQRESAALEGGERRGRGGGDDDAMNVDGFDEGGLSDDALAGVDLDL
jgi:DNA excision repair protein ERCC-2